MKLALDTTYFLFGFGIEPENIPRNCLQVLESNSEKIFLSDMVIFEMNAKASKFNSKCIENDSNTKLIVEDPQYKIFLSSKRLIWDMSCFIRRYHKDYVDCVHWATAIDIEVDYTKYQKLDKRGWKACGRTYSKQY